MPNIWFSVAEKVFFYSEETQDEMPKKIIGVISRITFDRNSVSYEVIFDKNSKLTAGYFNEHELFKLHP